MDLLAGEADVGGGRYRVLLQDTIFLPRCERQQFATRLRRVVFIGQPPLRLRLDIQRVGLRAVGGLFRRAHVAQSCALRRRTPAAHRREQRLALGVCVLNHAGCDARLLSVKG